MLRISFSPGRDRTRRHDWIPLFGPPGKRATDREVRTPYYIQYLKTKSINKFEAQHVINNSKLEWHPTCGKPLFIYVVQIISKRMFKYVHIYRI